MKEQMTPTTFSNQVGILAELWLDYRGDEDFKDFIEYNDLGLPLAYAISEGIVVEPTNIAMKFIEETFDLLLAGLEVEDIGFESLEEVLAKAESESENE